MHSITLPYLRGNEWFSTHRLWQCSNNYFLYRHVYVEYPHHLHNLTIDACSDLCSLTVFSSLSPAKPLVLVATGRELLLMLIVEICYCLYCSRYFISTLHSIASDVNLFCDVHVHTSVDLYLVTLSLVTLTKCIIARSILIMRNKLAGGRKFG